METICLNPSQLATHHREVGRGFFYLTVLTRTAGVSRRVGPLENAIRDGCAVRGAYVGNRTARIVM